MSTEPEGKENRSELEMLARTIVAVQNEQVPVSTGPWKRQVRTWEALLGMLTVVTFLILYFLAPITSARDDMRDMKTAQALLIKTVQDHENRLHADEVHNIEFEQLKDSRGKRLLDVEDTSKANTLEINRHTGALIQLQTGQTILQKSVDDGNRKLDDLLSNRKR